MKKIGYIVCLIISLIIISSSEAEAQTINCGWCGTNCVDMSKGDLRCPMMAQIDGQACVNEGGKCVTTSAGTDKVCRSDSDCGVNEYCYQEENKYCPEGAACQPGIRVCRSKKKLANEGEACGGFRGIMCAPGLYCQPNTKCGEGKKCPDSSGICTKEECTPRLPCMDGIKNSEGNLIYCDPKPGINYCSKTKLAQKGETCGGFVGIMCAAGLRCDYGGGVDDGRIRPMIADATGICVMDSEPTKMPIILGDVNGDGKINLVDFSIWKKEYRIFIQGDADPNKPTKWKTDFNEDGKIDMADFSIWKKAFIDSKKIW